MFGKRYACGSSPGLGSSGGLGAATANRRIDEVWRAQKPYKTDLWTKKRLIIDSFDQWLFSDCAIHRRIDLVQLTGFFGQATVTGWSWSVGKLRDVFQVRTWWQKVMERMGLRIGTIDFSRGAMLWYGIQAMDSKLERFGKHHFFFYISGSLITFSYLCSFRSNLGWLASHCRLKTQVLELQTFMSFRNWHLLVCWEFALGQHVQLDPDIVFEHLWTTFDWSSCFLLLLTVHIRTKSFRVLSHICNERKNIFLHWHQSGTQTYCWWTTSIQNPASSDMIR